MKETYDNSNCTRDLTKQELNMIFGGDEFTESIFRFLGYVARKLSDIDWANSSWGENLRAQR